MNSKISPLKYFVTCDLKMCFFFLHFCCGFSVMRCVYSHLPLSAEITLIVLMNFNVLCYLAVYQFSNIIQNLQIMGMFYQEKRKTGMLSYFFCLSFFPSNRKG